MTAIQMPKLGHTMTEGKVIRWHKQPGEAVRHGETILTIETDKTEVEIESPVAGMMGVYAAREGDTVAVGGMLVTLLAPGEHNPQPARRRRVDRTILAALIIVRVRWPYGWATHARIATRPTAGG